jgi:hypothetical protein
MELFVLNYIVVLVKFWSLAHVVKILGAIFYTNSMF